MNKKGTTIHLFGITAALLLGSSGVCFAQGGKHLSTIFSGSLRPLTGQVSSSLIHQTMKRFTHLFQMQMPSSSLAAHAFCTRISLPSNAAQLLPADSLFIRATRLELVEKPTISLPEALHALNTHSYHFHKEQTEDLFLTFFPALAIEGNFIPTATQRNAARNVYKHTLAHRDIVSNVPVYWAKKMSAVTNLGFFGTLEDVPAVFQVAKELFSPEVFPYTDLILARALLNLNQPQAVQELADLRLSQLDYSGNLLKLSPAWHDIKKYMDQTGYPLILPLSRIASTPTQAQLPQKIQKILGRYNTLNLLQVDSSAEVTRSWLDLKKGLQAKMLQADVQQQVAEQLASPGKPTSKMPDLPETKTYEFNTTSTSGISTSFHAPAFSQREADAKQALLQLNNVQVQQAQQEVSQLKKQLNHTLPKQFGGKGTGSPQEVVQAWEQWYEAQEKLTHTQNTQKMLQASIQDNIPANRISQMVDGYDVLVPPLQTTFHVSRRILVGLSWDDHSFTIPANALSKKDAQLKQALLDETTREHERAQENIAYYTAKQEQLHATARQSRYDLHPRAFEYQQVEEQLAISRTREINALVKQNYIITEIQHHTPATTIFKHVHPDKNANSYLDLWQEPKRTFTFQGKGEYPGFTAMASTRAQAQAKQEVLEYALNQFEKAKKQAAFVQFEIELERNARPFWKRKKPASQPLQQQLQKATVQLEQAQTHLQQVRALIQQEVATPDIIYQVYGHKPVDPNTLIQFVDRTAPAGSQWAFNAKVSSVLDAQVKQELLDKAAAKYNRAKATFQQFQSSADLANLALTSDYQTAHRALRAAQIEMGVTRSEITKGSSLKTIRNAVQNALKKEGLFNP